MATTSHERGVYQPPAEDLRYYEPLEDEETERSRLPLLIIIALLVLAAFAGVVWLAYNQGIANGRGDGPLVVTAPEGPVKTAPDQQTGAETPYTGLKIYTDELPPDQDAQNSALAEAPLQTPPLAPTVGQNAPPAASPAVPPALAKAEQVANAPPRGQPTEINIAAPPPGPPVASQGAPRPATTAPQLPAALAAAPKSAAPARQMATLTPPAKATAAPVTSGSAMLQIGSYESEDLARAAWSTFQKRYGLVGSSVREDIQRADLGAKGVWYRLRIGPFSNKSDAVAFCDKLKGQGAGCFPS